MTFKIKRLWALLMALAMLVGVAGTALAKVTLSDPVDLNGRIVRPQPTPDDADEGQIPEQPGEPSTDPGTDPDTEPGIEEPGPEPGADPGTDPGADTGTDPGTDPDTDEPGEPEQPETPAEPEYEVVTEQEDGKVNLRRTPEIAEDNIITSILRGARLTVLEREGDWVKVVYNGQEGYVNARFVTEVPAEAEQPDEPEEEPTEVPFESKYQRDEDGNLILDENGNPIPLEPMEGEVQYKRDEEDNLVLDENGEPVAVVEEDEPAPFESKYQRDGDGNLILDENGNPIPLEPTEGEVQYKRDADGNLELDENGEPVIKGSEEEEPPERSVSIRANVGSVVSYGDVIVLTGVLTGYDDITYTMQWQAQADGGWVDLPDERGISYSFVLDENNIDDSFRLEVTVVDA
ncbi:MAG: SH3 domain-containing protein [Christensenellaceae bacterium]|nr:SH3 domain-containing protein [Christensenellaceae bacterium]